MENFICNQYEERLAIFKHRKYQNLWMNNKVRGNEKNAIYLSFLPNLQKI